MSLPVEFRIRKRSGNITIEARLEFGVGKMYSYEDLASMKYPPTDGDLNREIYNMLIDQMRAALDKEVSR